MPLSLEEHIRRSRQAVEANKAKGNRHAEFLTMLYADPCRFLDEIIQNTEDAYARRNSSGEVCALRFCVFPDRLDIMHNGIDFDENDLKALTTFAGTTKNGPGAINQIGKFGIGFRSVYSVTNQPEIHCHPYHFRIEEYEILEKISPTGAHGGFRTLIRLSFKKEGRSRIYRTVVEGLKKLDEYQLLFLKHLNRFEIYHGDKLNRTIKCLRQPRERNLQRVGISIKGKINARHEFLMLSRTGGKAPCRFAMAFRLAKADAGEWIIVPDHLERLFVFLPTQQASGLRFLFHADFATTATREQVPFGKEIVPENTVLLHKAASFFAACLPAMRDSGYLRPAAFRVLMFPFLTANTANIVSRVFAELLQTALKKGKFMPAMRNAYETAGKTAFTMDPDIADLLNRNALQSLFQRSAWLNEEFVGFPELHAILFRVLDVKNVDAASLGFRISVTPGFIGAQKREWFARFYEFLSLHSELWDEAHQNDYYSLRGRDIILLQNGALARAFDVSGLPVLTAGGSGKAGNNEIDRKLQREDGASCLFRMLGLSSPDHQCRGNHAEAITNEDVPPQERAGLQSGISVSPETVAEKNRAVVSDFVPGRISEHDVINAGIELPALAGILLPLETPDTIRNWAVKLVALVLRKHYPDAKIEKSHAGLSEDDLKIKSTGADISVFVASRRPGEINFSMPQKYWFAIFENEKPGTQLLALVADAGSTSAKVQLITNPGYGFSANRFVFDDVGFRLL